MKRVINGRLLAMTAILGWQLMSALPLSAVSRGEHAHSGQHHYSGQHASGHHPEGKEGQNYHHDEGQDLRKPQDENINVNGAGSGEQPVVIDPDTPQDQADQVFDSYGH